MCVYHRTDNSADGRYIALMALSTANDNDLFVEELSSGDRIHITPHSGDVSSSPSDFSPDGRYLYYTSDAGGEFQRLLRHDLLSGESEEVLSLDWDIMYGSFSREGNYFVVGVNVDARTELRLYDATTMAPMDAPEVAGANVSSVSFSQGDAQIALYASGSRFPRDLFGRTPWVAPMNRNG